MTEADSTFIDLECFNDAIDHALRQSQEIYVECTSETEYEQQPYPIDFDPCPLNRLRILFNLAIMSRLTIKLTLTEEALSRIPEGKAVIKDNLDLSRPQPVARCRSTMECPDEWWGFAVQVYPQGGNIQLLWKDYNGDICPNWCAFVPTQISSVRVS